MILVAFAAIPWSAVSLARRFAMVASRSTTWPVTSTASVCSVTTLVVSPPSPWSRSSADSHLSAGMR